MSHDNVFALKNPAVPNAVHAALTEVLQEGARTLLGHAIEAEVAEFLALGINLGGEKELLGLWIAQTEGAKFWLQVVTLSHTRRQDATTVGNLHPQGPCAKASNSACAASALGAV